MKLRYADKTSDIKELRELIIEGSVYPSIKSFDKYGYIINIFLKFG